MGVWRLHLICDKPPPATRDSSEVARALNLHFSPHTGNGRLIWCLSVGLFIQGEAMNVGQSPPQGAHYLAEVTCGASPNDCDTTDSLADMYPPKTLRYLLPFPTNAYSRPSSGYPRTPIKTCHPHNLSSVTLFYSCGKPGSRQHRRPSARCKTRPFEELQRPWWRWW